jgi:proteasome assembly chaperone (PAC2) family protein
MVTLRWDERPQGLRAPALVFAFGGWNDAAEAASTALSVVGESLNATRVADIDPDDLFDFQAVRPIIDLSEPGETELIWPEIVLYSARVPGAARDVLLLAGPEPSFRWSAFCNLVLDTAEEFGVELVVGMGALLADVPHTRPVLLTGIASPGGLVEGMDARAPSYRGPTGIVGVLHAAAAARGLSTVSLWAPVPHYVAGAPNPAGALALVRGLERVTGVAIDAGSLENAVVEHVRHVTAAVDRDPAARQLVERLEEAAEEQDPPFGGGPLPTGDALAEELERFLRQREAEPD